MDSRPLRATRTRKAGIMPHPRPTLCVSKPPPLYPGNPWAWTYFAFIVSMFVWR